MAAAWKLAALLVLVLLKTWQGEAYVEHSDGVYAASARAYLAFAADRRLPGNQPCP